MLPDGRCFLYYARGDREHRGIYVASLDGGEPARIVESMFNAVYASGHLITMRDGVVVAYPFDEESARLTGDIWVADLDRAALTRPMGVESSSARIGLATTFFTAGHQLEPLPNNS